MRALISEGLTDHARGVSKVQNTLQKPRRTESLMIMRICEYHTEEIALWTSHDVKKINRRGTVILYLLSVAQVPSGWKYTQRRLGSISISLMVTPSHLLWIEHSVLTLTEVLLQWTFCQGQFYRSSPREFWMGGQFSLNSTHSFSPRSCCFPNEFTEK